MSPSIYNTTDGPLTIDRAGRMLAAGERRDVDDLDGSPLAGHIDAERIIVIDTAPTDDDQPTEEPAEAEAGQTTTTPRARKGRATTQES